MDRKTFIINYISQVIANKYDLSFSFLEKQMRDFIIDKARKEAESLYKDLPGDIFR